MQNITDEPDTTIEQEEGDHMVKAANHWLNNHERPSFDHLMSIAKRHTSQAAEIIMEYAETYDVQFDPTMPLEEAVQRIWQAMESSPDQTQLG
jgi:hypothetical protein